MSGIVFDFQRFALHDGPGVRSVAFLKGCPLICKWCCNPESQEIDKQIAIAFDKCSLCKQCETVCNNQNHKLNANTHDINRDECKLCGKCLDVCPTQALKIFGYEMQVEDLVSQFLKDEEFYKNTGGGITLSGGEPLMQFYFASEILKLSKARGLHTAIETTGYVSEKKMDEIFPFVDLFLYDYKITDDAMHQLYTGVSNKLIIKNLKYILKRGAEVFLRCVIIPGINDNDIHFKAIAELENSYANIKQVELMPFHEYGKHKYADLGMKYENVEAKMVSKKQALEWTNRLKSLGCKNVIIG